MQATRQVADRLESSPMPSTEAMPVTKEYGGPGRRGVSIRKGLKELMESNESIERLRDPTALREALMGLGLDLETVQLVADLAPSRGVTAFATETSVCVG